jgi:stearoyl-CoA desaturase (delta-9 desaturase)
LARGGLRKPRAAPRRITIHDIETIFDSTFCMKKDAVGAGPHGDDIAYPSSLGFLLVHLGCFAALWTGFTWRAAALALVLYVIRIFAIGAGYHRYFAHRAFATSRVFQFILAWLAQSSAQRGILWWAAHHRRHHRYADTPQDIHSPAQRGFLYAHLGWIFVPRNNESDYSAIRDLARFPELMWLDRQPFLPALALGVICWLIAGWPGVTVGFCWSTVVLWHATFCINSLAHVLGRQRYVTGDHSRNNWLLALLTMGEGWHNNHHAYQASARQGFRWWEFDPTYYILRALAWAGVVWDLHNPPQAVIKGEQRLGRIVIDKVAGQLAASFPINQIAHQVQETLIRAAGWTEMKARIAASRAHAGTSWSELDLPEVPSLEDVRRYAAERLAKTRSLEEIAVQARERLLELICARLSEA